MTEEDWQVNDEQDMFGDALHNRAHELESIPDADASKNGLIECPVLPLRDMIVLPSTVSPVYVGRKASLAAIEAAHAKNSTMIGLVQFDPSEESPGVDGFLKVGVELAVGKLMGMPKKGRAALVQGRRRIEISELIQLDDFMIARGRIVNMPIKDEIKFEALSRTVLRLFTKFSNLAHNLPSETLNYIMNSDHEQIADLVVSAFPLALEEQRNILMQLDELKRLSKAHALLKREVAVLKVENEIDSKVNKVVERGQREAYLREQLKSIQSELGEADPWMQELDEIHERITRSDLPKEPKKAAFKELNRLGMMPPMSPEVGVIRTFLDWLVELPWKKKTKDNLNVTHAAEVLDAEHFGLPKAKDRILEYIAVRNLKPKKSRQPILCFIGPPGTGKTSLGRSMAKALGRKFVRLSLGGVRDEAEIRGHRRTYIGALPGRILQTMRRAGTINPLFFLDEIDKLGSDMRGDPSSALLEVLDPEQNNSFSDHYLELPYDLSNVMFVTTANYRADIPWALLDRMEVIEFPGYIEEEKIEIAKRFQIPRQLAENGLEAEELQFSEAALKRLVREYTYEAGVRNLEREIGNIVRKLARKKSEKKEFAKRITPAVVEKLLGAPKYAKTEAEQEDEIGVATALAWTEGGGDIMPVEVLLMEGKGGLQITGNIGEIMEESAQAALSYLKSRAKEFKLDLDLFEKTDVHVHIPEGAVPKDGPSAGVTLATAIISAFTKRAVRKDVAMTGEVTLRGRVLPVGGVRDKVLAAHRAGLKTIILPARNQRDLVDVPKNALNDLEIIPVTKMDEVLEAALVKPKPARKTTTKVRVKPKSVGKASQPPVG